MKVSCAGWSIPRVNLKTGSGCSLYILYQKRGCTARISTAAFIGMRYYVSICSFTESESYSHGTSPAAMPHQDCNNASLMLQQSGIYIQFRHNTAFSRFWNHCCINTLLIPYLEHPLFAAAVRISKNPESLAEYLQPMADSRAGRIIFRNPAASDKINILFPTASALRVSTYRPECS